MKFLQSFLSIIKKLMHQAISRFLVYRQSSSFPFNTIDKKGKLKHSVFGW